MAKPQIVVVGLDGATFDVIRPLIARGSLPNIGRLMAEGTSATLKSTIHPITPSAWASMVTGLNPGKHGVFDFRRRKPDSYQFELVNGGMRDGTPIWTILNQHGKKTGMLNIPLTYPPDQVDGFVVSGMDAPSSSSNMTYPRRLYQRMQQALGEYIIDFSGYATSEEEYLRSSVRTLDIRVKSVHFLCEEYPDLDFLFVVFVAPDRLQHAFWCYVDPSSPQYHLPKAHEYRSATETAYGVIDDAIGWLMSRFGDGTYYLLVSDHGFGPLHKDVYLNKWLSDIGLLKFREDKEAHSSLFPSDVDWSATKAYSFGHFGNISINLHGREPSGAVAEGKDAEQIKEFIIRELHELTDPESHSPVVDRVFRKEQLYSGPYFFGAPDLLIVMKNYTYMTRDSYDRVTPALMGPPMELNPELIPHTGNHNLDGIFVLRGEGVTSGLELPELHITDVAPTILYLLDLPIPNDMDGRVPLEAMTGHPLAAKSPSVLASKPSIGGLRANAHLQRGEMARLQQLAELRSQEIAVLRSRLEKQAEEVARLESLVAAYNRGRFIRCTAALDRVIRRLRRATGG